MRLRCVSHIHVYGAQFPGQSIHFKMTLQRKSFTNCDLKLVVSASGCYIHTQITIYIHILYYQFTRLYRIMYFCHERKGIPFHLRHCGPEKCDLYAHFPQNDDSAKMLILNTISDNLQKSNAFHEKIAQSVIHSIPEWIGTVFMGSKHSTCRVTSSRFTQRIPWHSSSRSYNQYGTNMTYLQSHAQTTLRTQQHRACRMFCCSKPDVQQHMI